MDRIIHVAWLADWEPAEASGVYGEALVAREGFIHLCTPAQLPGVIGRYFGGRTEGLIALHVDPTRLGEILRWEASPTGERFPHLYRALRVEEVEEVSPLAPLVDSA